MGDAFLETLQFPIQDGRSFTARDDRSAPRGAIVSRTLAEHLWPGESALGKRVSLNGSKLEVVGMVGDGRFWAMTDQNRSLFLQPLVQNYRGETTVVVRMEHDPGALASGVREIFRQLDLDVPLHSVRTMDQQLSRSPLGLMPLRMGATLAGAQGAIALLLAALGIFGLVSLSVTQRCREIGIPTRTWRAESARWPAPAFRQPTRAKYPIRCHPSRPSGTIIAFRLDRAIVVPRRQTSAN